MNRWAVHEQFSQVDQWIKPGVMAALLTCSMLILMGGAAVTPGLPGMQAHFSEYGDLTSFIITLPHLAVAIVGFLMGVLVDGYGKVRADPISEIFIVTGTGSYFLDNIYAILVLRFLLGFGLAGIVCTVTSLTDATTRASRGSGFWGSSPHPLGWGSSSWRSWEGPSPT